jgi:diguanylate cyclase (GGDEF)-like protein/PAS domain S-box-containing protein
MLGGIPTQRSPAEQPAQESLPVVEMTAGKLNVLRHRFPPAMRLLEVAIALALVEVATSLLNMQSWHSNGVTILWPSNGLLIGILLCARRREWPCYMVIAFAIDVAVSMLLHVSLLQSAYDGGCNMIEVGLAAALIYPCLQPKPDLTERRQLFCLVVFGVLLAPGIASFLAQLYVPNSSPQGMFLAFKRWFLADALGNAVMVPLYLSLHKGKPFLNRSRREVYGLFVLLFAATIAVFCDSNFPGLFLLTPFLLLLGFRLRLAGSATGLLLISVVGGFFTISGEGPFAMMRNNTNVSRDVGLQIFIAVSMLVVYGVELIVAEIGRRQASLKESETRFRLLAEASNDIIVLADLDGRRRYVSPAVTNVLGWLPRELTGQDLRQLVFPEDVAGLVSQLDRCVRGESIEPTSYRSRHKDGHYVWMEASIRLCRNEESGEPIGFVKVARDISSRKAAEDELNLAFTRAANLALMDSLTGIANRRQFDDIMDREMRRAMRDNSSLSLLMIDVDHFKGFNDLYGHIAGDECLRVIAHAIQEVIHRMTDLFARYGGEEFVAVLPNTDSRGAQIVAEQIRSAVERIGLPHAGSPHGVVTVSIGCATQKLSPETIGNPLLLAADAALYQAKSADRNCIEIGEEISTQQLQ